MAHFAKVVNGVVEKVIVAEQSFIDSFVDSTPGTWLQTSYNTYGGVHYQPNSSTPSEDQSQALRYNFAGVGYLYNSDADAFYQPQPFPSWTLNTSTYLWDAPVEYPTDGQKYDWNEEIQNWELS